MIAYKLCGTCMCVRFSMSAVCKASSRVGSGELDEVEALLAEEGMADLDLVLRVRRLSRQREMSMRRWLMMRGQISECCRHHLYKTSFL